MMNIGQLSLKKDDSIMILPSDKGRVTVVLNKDDYCEKYNELLRDEKTFQKLHSYTADKF